MYIQMISIHGLIRGESVEMGRDADTGGQVRYVLELAKTLSAFDEVEGVDLFTRRIRDKRVSPDYSQTIEQLSPKCRLIRLPCGGGSYIRKERLWPFLDDYVDAMISFTRKEGRVPTVVHGHYADAGYIGKEVASVFDAPFVFTGHSLGKTKLDYLLAEGWDYERADREYNIDHRIGQEQACIAVADLIVTSTKHERDTQYRDYYKDEQLRFEVLPPGTDLDRFFPYYEYDMPHGEIDERFKQARVRMLNDLGRFHFQPDKPLILALCRPDRRKNIGTLIEAYGRSKQMQALANLAVFAGVRKDIEAMEESEQRVLTDMLMMMDRFDLYGKLAIPKWHDSERDVPELYRIAAEKRGIFVNPAFTELFGLTVIEASATGLPFVATQNGGPEDIAANCESGLLVDVIDENELSSSIIRLLTDTEMWDRCSANGVNRVREHYSWETHCANYLKCVKEVARQPTKTPSATGRSAPGRRLASVDRMLITDIDNTLLGDDDALARLRQVLHDNRDHMGFGIASGRSLELVVRALEENGLDEVDVIIAAVGSEIYYGKEHFPDKGWASHLRLRWRPDRVRETLAGLPFLRLQDEPQTQREFKISYDLDEAMHSEEALPRIHDALAKARLAYKLVFSHGTYIDILPHRASKGKAVRYLSGKWNIPLNMIATAGDSGNDRDMLLGQTAGIVVGNYDEELESLRKSSKTSRVHFAQAHCAGGIIEGLKHYAFTDAEDNKQETERNGLRGESASRQLPAASC